MQCVAFKGCFIGYHYVGLPAAFDDLTDRSGVVARIVPECFNGGKICVMDGVLV